MKIKEWIFDYCQDYSFPGQINPDCDAKPTLKLFLYNVWRKFRGLTPIWRLRMIFQKIFRRNHLCDYDVYEAQICMAKRILPVLYAFRNSERMGHPSIFSEYEENSWGSREEYDEAINSGRMIGGGEEQWIKELNHIIDAVEFIAFEGTKKITAWWLRIFNSDPWCRNETNKYFYYTYKIKDSNHTGITFRQKPENDKYYDIEEHISYGNSELLEIGEKYVNEGLEKLGKYWRCFWD